MNFFDIAPDVAQRFAGSLLHFVWQGAIIALLTAVGLRFLRRNSAETRYALSIFALVLMLIVPVLTFTFYAETGALALKLIQTVNAAETTTLSNWILALWCAGVLGSFLRLLVGWRLSWRLVRSAEAATAACLQQVFVDVKERLGLNKPVRLLVHACLDSPIVVGWVRPVVLLPITLTSGLTEAHLVAIFAHELAHIRRHDFLVNILQRCVESILFYHPAVWWLSKRIRNEREHCCDDVAVAICGSPRVYAEALIQMEHARVARPLLAVAAADGSVLQRFRRVLGLRTSQADWQSAVATVLFLVIWIAAGATVNAAPPVVLPPLQPLMEPPATLVETAMAVLAGPPVSQDVATLRGIVVRFGTTDPLSGTIVELIKDTTVSRGSPAAAYTVTTEGNGTFVFSNVAPGDYRLIATRTDGFLPAEYGQRRPNVRGLPLTLTAGQIVRDVQLAMSSPASITGRILDRNGRPVGRAQVQALKNFYRDGRRELAIAQAVLTNDLGEYRLFWLQAGEYYIAARRLDANTGVASLFIRRPEDRFGHFQTSDPVLSRLAQESGQIAEFVHVSSYFPGTTDVQRASSVTLAAGSSVSGMDVQLQSPVLSHRIRGVVTDGKTGQVMPGVKVSAIRRNTSPNVTVASATTDKNGAYEILGVVPGSYDMFAGSNGMFPPYGLVSVEMGAADLENVGITVSTPVDIRGKVTLVGGKEGDIAGLRLSVDRKQDMMGMPQSRPIGLAPQIDADGSFSIGSVAPGDYTITATSRLENGYVKSMQIGPVDLLRNGLRIDSRDPGRVEIVISANGASVTGTVVDQKRSPVPSVMVALVPDLSLRGRGDLFKSTVTDTQGHFTLKGVAPGNYKIFAWEDVDIAWMDEEFLRPYEGRGSTLRLEEAGRQDIELPMIGSSIVSSR
jgi:beta-lactamase regulating signal transducer with metallopeptidase domain/protocatechuate 3,4-dioxygenase beta subunit